MPWRDLPTIMTAPLRGKTACPFSTGLLALAFANLLRGPGRAQPLAPYLLASLLAAVVVGMVSSLLDMPRTAFLFFLLLCFALFLDENPSANPPRTPVCPPEKAIADLAQSKITA